MLWAVSGSNRAATGVTCALAALAIASPARAKPTARSNDVTAALKEDAPERSQELPTRARIVASSAAGTFAALGWLPDGSAVLVAREDAIEWRDPSTLEVARTVALDAGEHVVAFLPEGAATTRTGRDGKVALGLRRFAEPTIVAPLLASVVAQLPPDAAQLEPSFSADGARVLFQGFGAWFGVDDAGFVAEVYDVASERRLGVYPFSPAGPIASAELAPSGRFVEWTSRTLAVFTDVAKPVAGPDYRAGALLSPDDRFVITDLPGDVPTSELGSTSPALLRAKNGRRIYALDRDAGGRADFCPSGVVFAASGERRIALYRIDRSDAFSALPIEHPRAISFAPGGDRAAIASQDGALHLALLETCARGDRPACRASRACAISRRRPAALPSGG